ncbi:MAG: hypothetical protein ABJE95_04190 [Byssovorax sp.]
MHNPFDQLAKKVGKQALDASGVTVVQHEISRDAQHADLLHDPNPARNAERARLGLLGRLAAVLCLLEVFGHAPDGAELRACLSKHFAHWAERERTRAALNRKRAAKPLSPTPLIEPFLWILAAAASTPMLRDLEVKPAPGWPPGVYLFGGDVLRVGIIVASELPRDRSTLLLRIMAAGPRLREAVADLAALPANAHERTVAEQILISLQGVLDKKSSRTPEEEEFIVSVLTTWTEAKEEGRSEGRTEGRSERGAGDVLTVLRVRGIAVPDAARERISTERDPERLERWLERAIVAASVAEVLDDPS